MLNRKYFPFERNSYYYGKLLTAKDFEAEQKYFNDKRRLSNRLLHAWGIVYGLGLVAADDTSVVLQSGCALDPGGREMVVPETQVLKLSTIDGFAELEGDTAYLGIAYDEQPADEVYSAIGSEGSAPGARYNKYKEGCRLFLCDERHVERVSLPIDDYVTQTVIYADESFKVVQHTSRYAAGDSLVSVQVEIACLAHKGGVCSLYYEMETAGFDYEGQDRVIVSADQLRLAYGESRRLTYTLAPKSHIWGGNSSVSITIDSVTFSKDGESFVINNRLEIPVRPVSGGIAEYALSNYYKQSMDKTLEESFEEKLWLAKITLVRSNGAYIIDGVSPAPFGQYVYNSAQLMLFNQLRAYYPAAQGGPAPSQAERPAAARESVDVAAQNGARLSSCGVYDLPLGLGYEPKQPVFSDEIMHGLGKGPVYVDIGLEYIKSDEAGEDDMSEILLGDVGIFKKYETGRGEERLYQVSTAVKVLPDRGTFIAGLIPNETTGLISVRIRWYAFKVTELNRQLKKSSDSARCLLINPDTIILPPKGTAHISPVFVNMDAEACAYKLIDVEGGFIDNNGVYTAPAKEGVYEIRVEALSDPSIFAHAFAIVTQKKAADAGGSR